MTFVLYNITNMENKFLCRINKALNNLSSWFLFFLASHHSVSHNLNILYKQNYLGIFQGLKIYCKLQYRLQIEKIVCSYTENLYKQIDALANMVKENLYLPKVFWVIQQN